MPEITCKNKKCGHKWMSRVANPVKCPECGYPTGLAIPATIKEAINLPPSLPTIDAPQRIDFYPRLYLPSHRFATLDDQEWQTLEEEAIGDYKNWLREMRDVHKERQRQHIVELAGKIVERKRPYRRMWRAESIPTLITKLQNILRRNQVETKKSEWSDMLKSLESWKAEAELEKWLKETATSRRTVASSMFKKEEKIAELKEDEQIVKLAIPIFREIVSVYDFRIEELKKAEVEVAPLVEDANEIHKKTLKRIEEESRLIDKMCEADSFGRVKKLDELLKIYRPLSADISKAETEHREICGQINQFRIDPPKLLSFPPRKTLKLKFHDRILKKL